MTDWQTLSQKRRELLSLYFGQYAIVMNSGLQLYPQHIVRKRAQLIKQICDIEKLLFECVPEQQPTVSPNDKSLIIEDSKSYPHLQMTIYENVFFDKVLNRFFYMNSSKKLKSPKKHTLKEVELWLQHEGHDFKKRV